MAELTLELAIAALVAVALLFHVLGRLLIVCRPNEVVVISGRKHRLGDGSHVGFKVLHGGRGFRIPVLEEVNRLEMRLIPVRVNVQNSYSKGGIALTVHAIANVKITSDRALIRNAI